MNRRRKNRVEWGLVLAGMLCVLSACGKPADAVQNVQETGTVQTQKQETSTAQETGTVQEEDIYAEYGSIPLSEIDFDTLLDELNEEEKISLAGYLPVLLEGQNFLWTDGWSDFYAEEYEPEEVTLAEFSEPFTEEWIDDELWIHRIAVMDLDGDGTLELILELDNFGGHFLILHNEAGVIHGVDFVYRGFLALQENGVYIGSGGAGYNRYYKLHFADGRFNEEVLAEMEDRTFRIAGEEVDEDTFFAWTEEIEVGDAAWYKPVSEGQIH